MAADIWLRPALWMHAKMTSWGAAMVATLSACRQPVCLRFRFSVTKMPSVDAMCGANGTICHVAA